MFVTKMYGNIRVMSLNTLVHGGRDHMVKSYLSATRAWVEECTRKKPRVTTPITVVITAFFHDDPVDPDNLFVKGFIDGLKKYVVVDDSHSHIRSVSLRSRYGGQDAVLIEIFA